GRGLRYLPQSTQRTQRRESLFKASPLVPSSFSVPSVLNRAKAHGGVLLDVRDRRRGAVRGGRPAGRGLRAGDAAARPHLPIGGDRPWRAPGRRRRAVRRRATAGGGGRA